VWTLEGDHKPDERQAVTDERDDAGSVSTQPVRPTGKRSRRGAAADDTDVASTAQEAATLEDEAKAKKKKAKKGSKEPRPNPISFVIQYLGEVIAELRKVIWPNRKQMVTYTAVVLVFLAFMVTLIGLVDLGVARLVMLVFG
jgi:preprotein translocase subunit SecE